MTRRFSGCNRTMNEIYIGRVYSYRKFVFKNFLFLLWFSYFWFFCMDIMLTGLSVINTVTAFLSSCKFIFTVTIHYLVISSSTVLFLLLIFYLIFTLFPKFSKALAFILVFPVPVSSLGLFYLVLKYLFFSWYSQRFSPTAKFIFSQLSQSYSYLENQISIHFMFLNVMSYLGKCLIPPLSFDLSPYHSTSMQLVMGQNAQSWLRR